MNFVSLADYGVAPAADLLSRAFADYFVKIKFTPEMLALMARNDSVDFAASRVLLRGAEPVGAGLIACRGRKCRLAAMGLVPAARRQGAGRALVERVVAEAKVRGDEAMLLEVIEQNEAAVKLYAVCAFEKIRRLVGFGGRGLADESALAGLAPVEVPDAAVAIGRHGLPDLPWQIAGATIAQLGAPAVAYRRADAWVVLADPQATPVTIRGLVAANGAGEATALLRAVMAQHSDREWRAAPVWPEEQAAVFADAGLVRVPMSQWQMIRRL